MKKILLAALFATVAGALVFGAAASMTVTSNDLGSGSDDVSSCDAEVTVSYGVNPSDSSRIDTVTVSDIDETACAGETVYVTLTDDSDVVLETGSSAPVAGTSVDVIVDAVAADVYGADVTITG